jgi:dienelactone hydrolase
VYAKCLVGALCASVFVVPAARAASEAATRFGARQQVQHVSISPDGRKLAILAATPGRGTALLIADADGGTEPHPIMTATGDPERVTGCHWTTSTRLVCSVYMVVRNGAAPIFTRQVALDANGSKIVELSARSGANALGVVVNGGDIIDWTGNGVEGGVLMTRSFVPERSTGTHLASSLEGLGVERVDTTSLRRTEVEPPSMIAEEYISDCRGKIRIMGVQQKTGGGYDKGRIEYRYRKPGSKAWLPLSSYDINAQTGFNPYAVDPDLNVAYGFDKPAGRLMLYRIALDGSMKRELVYSRPDVDLDNLVRIGRQSRVVGVSFVTDRRQTVFFDAELKKLGHGLSKALPGLPLITFIDASADEKRLVLFAGSDVDPGHYYLYDKSNRQLSEIMPVRPTLDKAAVANVAAITFKAADGTEIPAYLTLPKGSSGKGLPAIVMPHGGPGARDEWGFDWLAQFFASRGFAVLQPNFRGSTGYGDAWFKENGFRSWRTAIGDVDDGGRWLVKQGIAAPGKLAIVGWSYGGYAALQSGVVDPDLFKAIVAIAPVTDLEALRQESLYYTNYKAVDAFIGNGPHVREGSPAQNASRIKAPVLMFHGDLDQNVGVGESRTMLSRLKDAGKRADLVVFKGLDHQLDDDKARTEMLDRADTFLRAELKIQ